MADKVNRILEKWMPLITPTSVVIGVSLSSWLHAYTYLVPWIFAFMTFAGSLGSNFNDLKRVILHPWPILACLLILHVAMPLAALGTGHILFPEDTYTITGLVLAFIIPTGIMSVLWVTIYKGNLALTLSLILVNTFLSPFIIPFSLKVLVGSEVVIDSWGMMRGLLWMIVLPSVVGMLFNQLTKGQVKQTLSPKLAPCSKIGLGVVVAINSAAVAPYLQDISWKLILIIFTVLLLASIGYMMGWFVARHVFHWNHSDTVALMFNSGMRNISAGAVLAVTFFPAPVAIPVITCMLIQQLLASLFGQMLRRFFSPDVGKESKATF